MLAPLAVSPQRAAAAHAVSYAEPVGCAAIAGTGTSFYENSRTYTDPVNDEADWKRSTPEGQGMDSAKLKAGLKTIENYKYLWSVLVVRNDRLVYERYLHGWTSPFRRGAGSATTPAPPRSPTARVTA